MSSFYFFFLMIRRPPRSTLSSSSAASDVYKRQFQASQAVVTMGWGLSAKRGVGVFVVSFIVGIALWLRQYTAPPAPKWEYVVSKPPPHPKDVSGMVNYQQHPFLGQESHVNHRRTAATGGVQNNNAAEASYAAIRITQYSTGLMTGATAAQQSFLTGTIMPAAIAFFQDTLKVYPVSGTFFVPYSCASATYYGGCSCAQCTAHYP
eukprot:TRINITY_DN24497_c0_g2_i3.p1 TRINITY_DN24497_c0_g2~~TRINITY_DN24497_c0_g2_i3.p1  ORF type:complete len:206 (-),score=47.46 TRINITY_DN24497_c0_g2_i3:14-631(-)